MDKLIQGILDFRANVLPGLRPKLAELANIQTPDTLFFACSDSRVVPNHFTSTNPGDLFTVRSVGNLVAPCGAHGVSDGDHSEASAIEFAVQVLSVKYVVVCGHSSCGAMKAVIAGREKLEAGTPNLARWLEHAEASKARLVKSPFIDPRLEHYDRVSQANVLQQLAHIETYPGVRARVERGELRLLGWWYDIGEGDVYVYDQEFGCFVLVDEDEGKRILDGRVTFFE